MLLSVSPGTVTLNETHIAITHPTFKLTQEDGVEEVRLEVECLSTGDDIFDISEDDGEFSPLPQVEVEFLSTGGDIFDISEDEDEFSPAPPQLHHSTNSSTPPPPPAAERDLLLSNRGMGILMGEYFPMRRCTQAAWQIWWPLLTQLFSLSFSLSPTLTFLKLLLNLWS